MLAGLVVACACLALGLIGALETRQVSITHGYPLDWSAVLLSRTPRWLVLGITMPFVLWFATRVPLSPVRANVVGSHLLLCAVISVVHAAVEAWAL